MALDKKLNKLVIIFGAIGLLTCAGLAYNEIIKKHNSLPNAYQAFMDQEKKMPSKMFNVNY